MAEILTQTGPDEERGGLGEEPPSPSRRVGIWRWRPILVTFTALAAGIILNIPLLGAIVTSFKQRSDIADGVFSVPSALTLDNYRNALYAAGYDFPAFLMNSTAISLGTVVLSLVICYPAAFAIARLGFGGARLLKLVSSLRLLPAIFFVIPFYLLFIELGLLDSIAALILANTFAHLSLTLLLLVAAFRDFPKEIEESALVDGCGLPRILTVIYAPLIAPTLVAVCLLTFLFSWSEYLFAVVLTSTSATPVTVGAANFVTSYELMWGEISAATLISLLPPVILAIVLQRYLVSGLTAGAVKG